MNFKKWVKSIQTAGCNGAHTVCFFCHSKSKVCNSKLIQVKHNMAVNQPSFLPSNKIYASKITIFLPKVKSDLGKIFLKFLHAGNYFSLLYRSLPKPTNSVSKKHIPPAWRDLKIFPPDHFPT